MPRSATTETFSKRWRECIQLQQILLFSSAIVRRPWGPERILNFLQFALEPIRARDRRKQFAKTTLAQSFPRFRDLTWTYSFAGLIIVGPARGPEQLKPITVFTSVFRSRRMKTILLKFPENSAILRWTILTGSSTAQHDYKVWHTASIIPNFLHHLRRAIPLPCTALS